MASSQKPCNQWRTQGNCSFGKRCRYRHGEEEKGVLAVSFHGWHQLDIAELADPYFPLANPCEYSVKGSVPGASISDGERKVLVLKYIVCNVLF